MNNVKYKVTYNGKIIDEFESLSKANNASFGLNIMIEYKGKPLKRVTYLSQFDETKKEKFIAIDNNGNVLGEFGNFDEAYASLPTREIISCFGPNTHKKLGNIYCYDLSEGKSEMDKNQNGGEREL